MLGYGSLVQYMYSFCIVPYPVFVHLVGVVIPPSLGSSTWVRVNGRLVRIRDQRDMDSQLVTVDQFSSAMVSIQEVIVSLKQRMDRQQIRQTPIQEDPQFDPVPPLPPSISQLDPSPAPFILHSQTEVAPPPINMPTPTSDDTHHRMDRLEQRLRQMRASN